MVHIMYGLPASGKTTFAMKLYESYCKKIKEENNWYNKTSITYLNLDEKDYKSISNITPYGARTIKEQIVIVDSFFKSIKDINKIWNHYIFGFDTSSIIIHVFKQDKQACFENDKLRGRKELATNSINEGQEEFDLDVFKTTFFKDHKYLLKDSNISVEYMDIIKYNKKDDYTIYSPWQVGDSIGEDFEELDNWLKENHPQITFLQYKEICKHIKIEENFTSDYYDEYDTRSIQRSIKISDIEKEIT